MYSVTLLFFMIAQGGLFCMNASKQVNKWCSNKYLYSLFLSEVMVA